MTKLIQWWMRDREAAHHPLRNNNAGAEDKDIERALELLQEGEISRAVRLLDTNSLGNLADARIVEQLQRKHPQRKM